MNCSKCGSRLVGGSAFCANCSGSQAAPPQSPPAVPQQNPYPVRQPALQPPPVIASTGQIPHQSSPPTPVTPQATAYYGQQQPHRLPPARGGKTLKIILFSSGLLLLLIIVGIWVLPGLLSGEALDRQRLEGLGFSCEEMTLIAAVRAEEDEEPFSGISNSSLDGALRESGAADHNVLVCEQEQEDYRIQIWPAEDADERVGLAEDYTCQLIAANGFKDTPVEGQLDNWRQDWQDWLEERLAIVSGPESDVYLGITLKAKQHFEKLLDDENIRHRRYKLPELNCDNLQ